MRKQKALGDLKILSLVVLVPQHQSQILFSFSVSLIFMRKDVVL